jgi:hypothetical protein
LDGWWRQIAAVFQAHEDVLAQAVLAAFFRPPVCCREIEQAGSAR